MAPCKTIDRVVATTALALLVTLGCRANPPTEAPRGATTRGASAERSTRSDSPPREPLGPVAPVHCFALDTSASMRYVLHEDVPLPPNEDAFVAFWSRLAVGKRELHERLLALEPHESFLLLTFDDSIVYFRAHPLVATSANIALAREWLEARSVSSTSDSHLRRLFETLFTDSESPLRVTLVWDGWTKEHVDRDGESAATHIEELNPGVHSIDPIGFDPRRHPSDRLHPSLLASNNWLRQVAERNGGTLHVLRVDPELGPPPRSARAGDRR